MRICRSPDGPGELQSYAPLDPLALRGLVQHALDVLMPAAVGPGRKPLGEAGVQLAIAWSGFARLVEADAGDRLARGEEVVERLRRASLHVYEHMAVTVPAEELTARNVDLVESCLGEGLPVVGSVTAELLLADGRTAAVRLTKETCSKMSS